MKQDPPRLPPAPEMFLSLADGAGEESAPEGIVTDLASADPSLPEQPLYLTLRALLI
jgi:hypothetical protein